MEHAHDLYKPTVIAVADSIVANTETELRRVDVPKALDIALVGFKEAGQRCNKSSAVSRSIARTSDFA